MITNTSFAECLAMVWTVSAQGASCTAACTALGGSKTCGSSCLKAANTPARATSALARSSGWSVGSCSNPCGAWSLQAAAGNFNLGCYTSFCIYTNGAVSTCDATLQGLNRLCPCVDGET